MTTDDVVLAKIRGSRLVGREYSRTMMEFKHDAAEPLKVHGRFPIGMEGHGKISFGLAMLRQACTDSLVGMKMPYGPYMQISWWYADNDEYDEVEGRLFEFRIEAGGEFRIFLPMEELRAFVDEVCPRIPADDDRDPVSAAAEAFLDAEIARILESETASDTGE